MAETRLSCPPPGPSPRPRKSQVQVGGRDGFRGKRESFQEAAGSPGSLCARHGVDSGTAKVAHC